MKHTLLIFIILSFSACKAQELFREYKFQSVKWTLRIPNNLYMEDSSLYESLKKNTIKKLDGNYDISSFENITPLFVLQKGEGNYFGSTINLYDSTLYSTWQKAYVNMQQGIINIIKSQGELINILDTSTSIEIIDKKIFKRFYIKTYYPSLKLTSNNYWFYRLHNNLDFSINVTYSDDKIGALFLKLLRESKFEE